MVVLIGIVISYIPVLPNNTKTTAILKMSLITIVMIGWIMI